MSLQKCLYNFPANPIRETWTKFILLTYKAPINRRSPTAEQENSARASVRINETICKSRYYENVSFWQLGLRGAVQPRRSPICWPRLGREGGAGGRGRGQLGPQLEDSMLQITAAASPRSDSQHSTVASNTACQLTIKMSPGVNCPRGFTSFQFTLLFSC